MIKLNGVCKRTLVFFLSLGLENAFGVMPKNSLFQGLLDVFLFDFERIDMIEFQRRLVLDVIIVQRGSHFSVLLVNTGRLSPLFFDFGIFEGLRTNDVEDVQMVTVKGLVTQILDVVLGVYLIVALMILLDFLLQMLTQGLFVLEFVGHCRPV